MLINNIFADGQTEPITHGLVISGGMCTEKPFEQVACFRWIDAWPAIVNLDFGFLLGLDHERLSWYHNGIERRLTDVHGSVMKGVLA